MLLEKLSEERLKLIREWSNDPYTEQSGCGATRGSFADWLGMVRDLVQHVGAMELALQAEQESSYYEERESDNIISKLKKQLAESQHARGWMKYALDAAVQIKGVCGCEPGGTVADLEPGHICGFHKAIQLDEDTPRPQIAQS